MDYGGICLQYNMESCMHIDIGIGLLVYFCSLLYFLISSLGLSLFHFIFNRSFYL